MKFIIYRNTRVLLMFASLTIDVVDDENTKDSRFCTSRAKFVSNSNERRCFLLNWQNKKVIRKIKILLIVWFRNVKRQRRRKSIKTLSFDVIRIFFRRRILFILNFFFALRSKIAISFDKMIKESKTIATKANFLSIVFSTRKILWVAFSTETLKSKVSKSEVIKKKITKNEKNIETMNKKHLQEFEEKNKEITLIDQTSTLSMFVSFMI